MKLTRVTSKCCHVLCSPGLILKMVFHEAHGRNQPQLHPQGSRAQPSMCTLAGLYAEVFGRPSIDIPKILKWCVGGSPSWLDCACKGSKGGIRSGWLMALSGLLCGLLCRLLQANQDEFSAHAPEWRAGKVSATFCSHAKQYRGIHDLGRRSD